MIELEHRELEIAVTFRILNKLHKRLELHSVGMVTYHTWYYYNGHDWIITEYMVSDQLENEYQDLIKQGVIDENGRLVAK